MYYEGEIIGGYNKVLSVKHGGMGIVYLCLDERDSSLVALKTIPHKYLFDIFGVERFIQEGRIWMRLGQHQNIVEAYKVEVIDGFPFIFMEQVVNESKVDSSLRTLLTSGSLSISSVINIAIDICSAFSHAYNISPTLIHRDLKPENILINRQGTAKVTDFGLSLDEYYDIDLPSSGGISLNYPRARKTKLNEVIGTPMYMAPELWSGYKADVSSDIYSFGCILFEMLSNRPAFVGDTIDELKDRHLRGDYVSLLSLNSKTPHNISSLVNACLENRKENRPESFDEILSSLSSETNYRKNNVQHYSKATSRVEDVIQSYINMGMYEHAKEHLSNHSDSIDDDLSKNRLYFYTHYGLGEYDKAIYFNELILNENNADLKALQNKAAILAISGRQEEAISIWKDCLEHDNKLAPSYMNLGHIYLAKKENNKALKYFKKAVRIDPFDSSLWHGMSYVYDSLGDTEKWIYCLRNAVNYTLDYSEKIIFFMKIINTEAAMYFDEPTYEQLLMSADYLPPSRLGKILNSTGYYRRAFGKMSNPTLDPDFTVFFVRTYVYVNMLSCYLTNEEMRKASIASEEIINILNKWVCLKETKGTDVYEYGLATLFLLYADVLYVKNKDNECIELITIYSNEIQDESLLARLNIGLGNYYLNNHDISLALKHYARGCNSIDDDYLYDVFGFKRHQLDGFVGSLSNSVLPNVSGDLYL
ncbi:serine/threonine-protein kinase [Pseudoalteromonas sp. S1609]|uniref:serine/threonine-protein kinase n=1 Tax=Pseudoalteromonas sp. S1609 TaxID=579505 RepID=UPI001486C017|nr:serine/threonine-protein kinase [Pseudoalteromonas sp. S1609]